jgi:hypothetical protein
VVAVVVVVLHRARDHVVVVVVVVLKVMVTCWHWSHCNRLESTKTERMRTRHQMEL